MESQFGGDVQLIEKSINQLLPCCIIHGHFLQVDMFTAVNKQTIVRGSFVFGK